MTSVLLRAAASATLAAASLLAQVPHGYALVCWKPQNPTATGGFRLVDRAGANTVVTGLSAATTGTTRWDGAQSVLVTDNGSVYAGLGVDNRTGAAPAPLDLHLILISGSAAVADTVFATVLQVPAGSAWKISDIKQRRDGNLLVATSEVLFTSNPMPQTQVFLVDTAANVTALPNTGFPAGSLLAVADLGGGRYAAAFQQQFFITNTEIDVCDGTGAAAPFQVFQFVNQSRFGGMDLDLTGELVVGVPFSGSTVVRIPPTPSATPVPVPSTPASVAFCDVLPGPGLVASFAQPGLVAGALNTVDSLVGGFTVWATTVVRDPIDVSLRADTAVYGNASSTTSVTPFLGSSGGWPRTGIGFGVIFWRGLRAAWLMHDDFGRYLALGVTVVVVVQGLINMSVVLGMMPTKGIPLPMISYGGSSLLSTLALLGILMNVSEHAG